MFNSSLLRNSIFSFAGLLAVSSQAFAGDGYSWKGWAGVQDAYKLDHLRSSQYSKDRFDSRIRLIHLEYTGLSSPDSWERAFKEAARHYESEDISVPSRLRKLVPIHNVSNSTKRIIGFYEYSKRRYGYVVITKVTDGKVHYVTSGGKGYSIGQNHGNSEGWVLGWSNGVFSLSGSYDHIHKVKVGVSYDRGTGGGVVSIGISEERR